MLVKITDIAIPDRFRVEMGDMEGLKKSLQEKGQLQTILLHKEEDGHLELIAGGRRLLALTLSGIEEVECIVREGWDRLTKREIEVEENIQRKAFTMVEEVEAKAELVRLREERKVASGEAGMFGKPQVGKEIAEEIGTSESTLSRDVALAKAFTQFPQLRNETSKTLALKKYKQLMEGAIRSALALIKAPVVPDKVVHQGLAEEVLPSIPDFSVACIVTDPPWGIDHQKMEMTADYAAPFQDSPEEAFATLRKVLPHLFRVLAENSHMYVFFAMKEYTLVRGFLTTVGFKVEPIPLIWKKGSGQNIWPREKFTPNYESIFFCKKGDRKLNAPSFAVFDFKEPHTRVHPTQKPTDLLREFIKLSTEKEEVVLDPFAGSGSTIEAALSEGRKVIAIEKEEYYANVCKLVEVKK